MFGKMFQKELGGCAKSIAWIIQEKGRPGSLDFIKDKATKNILAQIFGGPASYL